MVRVHAYADDALGDLDAVGLAEAIRGRGLELSGLRAHARLLSPLVAGSLERASSLAEAMDCLLYTSDAADE